MTPTPQKRLKKFSRDKPQNLPNRKINERDILIIDVINRYKFIPTSQLIRLVPGNHDITQRHLANLYHLGFINRFAFPTSFHPGEFNYFLDNEAAFDLLNEAGYSDELNEDFVRNNKGKFYEELTFNRANLGNEGRFLHLHHELMISRFHYMLEKSCIKSKGKIILKKFKQDTDLWNFVEVEKPQRSLPGMIMQTAEIEKLPHRPDAYFELHFPDENITYNYFYEADRKTMNTTRMKQKFRSHFNYIVKQKKHREDYKINRIRAVLVETIDTSWAEKLRTVASDPIVSGSKPSPLFWFTTSAYFMQFMNKTIKGKAKQIPVFLEKPELVMRKIWATPEQEDLTPDKLLSLRPKE